MIRNASKVVTKLLESALKGMAASQTSYSLANLNGVVDGLSGSAEDKNAVKDIASRAFDAGNSHVKMVVM